MGHGVGMVVHRRRLEHADRGVVDDGDPQCDAERHPVVVEGDHADHHEEVEVGLDVAAGQVDTDGGRGEQPRSCDCAAH